MMESARIVLMAPAIPIPKYMFGEKIERRFLRPETLAIVDEGRLDIRPIEADVDGGENEEEDNSYDHDSSSDGLGFTGD